MEELKQKTRLEASRFHNLQLARKTSLNSAYGALANIFFRWFADHLAESVTTSGQMSTMWTEIALNKALNDMLQSDGVDYCAYADTDSIYLNLDPLVQKYMAGKPVNEVIDFMDMASKGKIEKIIDRECRALTVLMNCPECKLHMKRENLADKGIWTGKKRYILNVWDSEGLRYKEAEVKVTGIESVRSSTPMACREAIKTGLKILMNDGEKELQKFIASFRSEFMQKGFEEVAFPRGINNLRKYSDGTRIYTKGTPIQVRGALLYNHYLHEMGLEDRYQPITEGSKVKFCYLKLPNPFRENVISVPEELPDEFDLELYLDRPTQFEKAFVEPLHKIAEVIGWKTKKTASLADLWA